MSRVDHPDQVRKSYGFDRKSWHCWVRAFFQFFIMPYIMPTHFKSTIVGCMI